MLPPRLLRRVVLAPLVIALAVALVVLSPLIALLTVTFSLVRRSPSGRMRGVRLLLFALAWLTAETATLFMCLGLWLVSGFGGRMHTEPFQSRHYAIMRWFLDVIYNTATGTFGLRVEVDEPELTAGEQAARLARPVIVLSRHAGPGDSLLLVHHLLSVYGRRPRVVMKATMQLDPSLDVVANRLPNVFVRHSRAGAGIFSEQIERLARGLDQLGALVIFPEGANWTPGRWRRGIRQAGRAGPRRPGRPGPGHAQPAPAARRRRAGRHRRLPRCRRDLRRPCRAGPDRHRRRRLAEPAGGPDGPGEVVAGAGRRGAPVR